MIYLVTGLGIYAVVVGLLMLAAPGMMFPRPPSDPRSGVDVVMVETGRGDTIALRYFPPPDDSAPVLLVSRGNFEDLGASEFYLTWLHEEGLGVLAYDYPGYGVSTGRATEASVEAAAQAAWDWLTGDQGVAPARVVLLGRSIGSGPAVWLATRVPAAGLILESAFTSAPEVMFRTRLSPWDPFPNRARLRAYDRPILLIHGRDDDIIPIRHSKALQRAAAMAPEVRTLFIDHVGHNDLLPASRAEYMAEVSDFARRWAGGAAPAPDA